MTADLQQPAAAEVPTTEPVVDKPSADTPDTAQSDTPADAKPPVDTEDDKKNRRHFSSIQKRIDELTRDKHEAHRAREAAEQRAAHFEAEARRVQGVASEPKLEQFAAQGKSYDEYLSARAEWIADQKVSAKLEEFARTNLQSFQQRDQQERAAQAAQQFNTALTQVEAEGKKAYPDFEEAVRNAPNLGPQVGQMVLATEKPHDISYYLAKNPEHALAIASMPPMLAMREIGKLEAQFVNKRVTSAPPPPRTVGGSEKGPQGLSDDLPPAEWYRRRAAQLRSGKS